MIELGHIKVSPSTLFHSLLIFVRKYPFLKASCRQITWFVGNATKDMYIFHEGFLGYHYYILLFAFYLK